MSPTSSLVYCLCSEALRKGATDACSVLFRLLCAQVLRSKLDLVPYVYEHFVKTSMTASLKRTRELLKHLFLSSGKTFLVIDGLDEYESSDQRTILGELSLLLKARPETRSDEPQPKLKLLICSRETKDLLRDVSRKLNQALTISLSQERRRITKDIATFARASLAELRGRFDDAEVDQIGERIVQKADGKVLISMIECRLTLSDIRHVSMGSTRSCNNSGAGERIWFAKCG
jgi:hypothetical protein